MVAPTGVKRWQRQRSSGHADRLGIFFSKALPQRGNASVSSGLHSAFGDISPLRLRGLYRFAATAIVRPLDKIPPSMILLYDPVRLRCC
jgi:hypothetical protein